MISLILPVITWATRGTGMRARDVWKAVEAPLLSGIPAGAVGFLFLQFGGGVLPQIPQLLLGLCLLFGTYLAVLLFVMRQRDFYLGLAKQAIQRG
jgi:hypothetical protein